MRVKFTKKHKSHAAGDTIEVSRNVAFGLIDAGVAVISKDMTPDDYKVARQKQAGVKANGKLT